MKFSIGTYEKLIELIGTYEKLIEFDEVQNWHIREINRAR